MHWPVLACHAPALPLAAGMSFRHPTCCADAVGSIRALRTTSFTSGTEEDAEPASIIMAGAQM
jgi:hypothetical protein